MMKHNVRNTTRFCSALGFALAIMLPASPVQAQTEAAASYAQQAVSLAMRGQCGEASMSLAKAIGASRAAGSLGGVYKDPSSIAVAAANQAVSKCLSAAKDGVAAGTPTNAADVLAGMPRATGSDALIRIIQGTRTVSALAVFHKCDAAWEMWGGVSVQANAFMSNPHSARAETRVASEQIGSGQRMLLQYCPREALTNAGLSELTQFAQTSMSLSKEGKCLQAEENLSKARTILEGNNLMNNERASSITGHAADALKMCFNSNLKLFNTYVAQTVAFANTKKCAEAERSLVKATNVELKEVYRTESLATASKALAVCKNGGDPNTTGREIIEALQYAQTSTSQSAATKCDDAKMSLSSALSLVQKYSIRDERVTSAIATADKALSMCGQNDTNPALIQGEAIAIKNAESALSWAKQGICGEAKYALAQAQSAVTQYNIVNPTVLALVKQATAATQACAASLATAGDAEAIKGAQAALSWAKQGICGEAKYALAQAQGIAAQYYIKNPDVLGLLSQAASASNTCVNSRNVTY